MAERALDQLPVGSFQPVSNWCHSLGELVNKSISNVLGLQFQVYSRSFFRRPAIVSLRSYLPILYIFSLGDSVGPGGVISPASKIFVVSCIICARQSDKLLFSNTIKAGGIDPT